MKRWLCAGAIGLVLGAGEQHFSALGSGLLHLIAAVALATWAAKTRSDVAFRHGSSLVFLATAIEASIVLANVYTADPQQQPPVLPRPSLFALGSLVLALSWSLIAGSFAWALSRKFFSGNRSHSDSEEQNH
jgi:hypothetical protein